MTRYVAQIIVQRIEETKRQSPRGFDTTSPSTEVTAYTDMAVTVAERNLSGLMSKITHALALAYPTVPAEPTDTPQEEAES